MKKKRTTTKRGSQLISYSNGEPLVSYIKMTRHKKEERQDIREREGKMKGSRGMDVHEEETGSRKYTRSIKKRQY